ncbi:hypothetical protein [Thiorhodovibrio frisius]
MANYQWHVQRFFTDFSARQCAFADVRVEDVEPFLPAKGRISVACRSPE